jgi:AhpD family alkylhydroperoxidase
MKARIQSPAMTVPGAMQALQKLGRAPMDCGVPQTTLYLLTLRASQINGCSVCVDMHSRGMKRDGEKDERIWGVSAWREMPYFTDAERAALALAESMTRLSDSADPVPDAVWDDAARHFDEDALAGLIISIGAINVWNRFNVPTRQAAGPWVAGAESGAQKNGGSQR